MLLISKILTEDSNGVFHFLYVNVGMVEENHECCLPHPLWFIVYSHPPTSHNITFTLG